MNSIISTSKEQLLLLPIKEFYHDKHHFVLLNDILRGKHKLSLRLLDWLITNYAKKYNIVYRYEDGTFNIFLEYKNQLKSFSKKFFDPFCRRNRIFYTNDHEVIFLNNDNIQNFKKRKDGIITTLAQLNAFRWFIKYGIIDYAIKYMEKIETDMFAAEKNNDNINKYNNNVIRQRRILSHSGIRGFSKINVDINVTFK